MILTVEKLLPVKRSPNRGCDNLNSTLCLEHILCTRAVLCPGDGELGGQSLPSWGGGGGARAQEHRCHSPAWRQ